MNWNIVRIDIPKAPWCKGSTELKDGPIWAALKKALGPSKRVFEERRKWVKFGECALQLGHAWLIELDCNSTIDAIFGGLVASVLHLLVLEQEVLCSSPIVHPEGVFSEEGRMVQGHHLNTRMGIHCPGPRSRLGPVHKALWRKASMGRAQRVRSWA